MHYYQFNIGDYRAATAHLSNDEDLAYRRLLDMYYDTENQIPLDTQWVAKRLRLDCQVVKDVLQDMFKLTETGWQHGRCEIIIEQYHAMAEKNRANGRLGGRKKNPLATDSQPIAKATINDKPITNNDIKESKDSLSSARLPTCPHQDILNLYKKHLPQLAQPRVWDGVRQTNLRQRWLQAAKPSVFSPQGYSTQAEGMAWWDSFFAYIANDTKLAQGFETKDRTWRPDLVWIVNATNFAKIIDGKYQK
jgi:uncharacterized protein YdaU (DUF1376 family)